MIWLISGPIVTAQELLPLFEQPSTTGMNGLVYGVDKIANTFVFTGNADVVVPSDLGRIRLTNQYRGTAFRTVTTAIRDDLNAQLSVEIPTVRGVRTLLRSAWVLSQDSRSLGLSSLARLSAAAGVSGQPADWWTYEAVAGMENTTQLGVRSTGPLAGVRTQITALPIELWDLNSTFLADWHRLDERRTNSDVDVRADVLRSLEDGSFLRVGGGYGALARQYFTSLTSGVAFDDVESRYEERLNVSTDVLYHATTALTFGFTGLVQAVAIARQFEDPVTGIPLTSVSRTSDEVVVDLDGNMTAANAWASATIGANLFQRTESNVADSVAPIANDDLAAIRSQENQRDNATERLRWYLRGWWRPSARDTMSVEWNWFLLRYDTPSTLNDDDRDELSALATIRYAYRVSDLLTVGAAVSGQYTHFIFLKASRSAQNNAVNALRFSPFVRINGGIVNMHPQFEILANYTVYDFEGQGASVRSFGFRQVSYRDSIKVRLTEKLRLEMPILVRYFERSTLLWGDFSEIPQLSNLEYLARFLIFSHPTAEWDVGAGLRLYTLEQRTLGSVVGIPSVVNAVRSWAPEIAIRYWGSGGSSLTLTGWYEFQTFTPLNYRELPNLLLLARVAL